MFLKYILRCASNYPPLEYKCPNRINYLIRHAYLNFQLWLFVGSYVDAPLINTITHFHSKIESSNMIKRKYKGSTSQWKWNDPCSHQHHVLVWSLCLCSSMCAHKHYALLEHPSVAVVNLLGTHFHALTIYIYPIIGSSSWLHTLKRADNQQRFVFGSPWVKRLRVSIWSEPKFGSQPTTYVLWFYSATLNIIFSVTDCNCLAQY